MRGPALIIVGLALIVGPAFIVSSASDTGLASFNAARAFQRITQFLVTVIYLALCVFVLPVDSNWYIGSVELLVVTFPGVTPGHRFYRIFARTLD